MSQQEQWRQIKGFAGLYDVSDKGRIYSYYSNKFLRPDETIYGYLQIILCKNGEKFKKLIHRLVAEEFIPNPEGLPEVHHIDECKSNNKVSNLQWVSSAYNTAFSKAEHYVLYGPNDERLEIYNLRKYARNNSLNYGSLRNVANGIINSYMGYTRKPGTKLNIQGKIQLISPEGEVVAFKNQQQAKDYIESKNINKLLMGKQKSCKGWTLP